MNDPTAWLGTLDLDFRQQALDGTARTVGRARHHGPLRVLRSLYPEGPSVCHQVLVHPPGGIVGGDELRIDACLGPQSHALLTTPGAARFYRSAGATAAQSLHVRAAEGSRLEWLPMETLVHDGARAHNALHFELAAGAETIGRDVVALGMPMRGEPFMRGRFDQRIAVHGPAGLHWLERGVIELDDPRDAVRCRRLLDSPLGWAGRTVLATLWFAAGTPIDEPRRDRLLDAARALLAEEASLVCGVSAPNPRVVVLRALGARVEPLMRLCVDVWGAWRQTAWSLPPSLPRVWRT